jgi:hypothetical protein
MRRRVREWEKIGASVQTLQWIRGGYLYTVQKQPPTPTIQRRSVATRRHPYPTRINRSRISTLRPSRGLVALYLLRLRFHTLASAQAGQQPIMANLRLRTTQRALRAEATPDGNATRSKAPNEKGRLHVQLRPTRRLLRAGPQPNGQRLFHHERTRTAPPTRGATHVVVPIPLIFAYPFAFALTHCYHDTMYDGETQRA